MDPNAAGTMGRTPGPHRRAFLIGGAGAALAASGLGAGIARAQPPGIPSEGAITFKVMRRGSHIGEHALKFSQDGDDLVVHIDVRIVVKIGPVPVYHHTQHAIERWRADRFFSLDSSTVSTAARAKVTARRTADGLRIEPASGPPYTATPDTLPQTHWNRLEYQGPLFNPENGTLLRETLVGRNETTVKLADGSTIRATRYTISGDGTEEAYYDSAGVWAGLHVKVEDGSFVDYLRI